MSGTRRAVALAPVAVVVAALAASSARADEDAARPDQPGFWEEILAPNEARIEALVERARELVGQGGGSAQREARDLLVEAVQLAPNAPLPRWELARLDEQAGDSQACARHLTHLARVEPDFQPPHSARAVPLLLDLKLAECLGATGDFAAATDRLRRILARGLTGQPRVHAWLAQLEMARGRLEAAAYALGQARRLRPHSSAYRFTAAVLHDRAGRPSAARRELLAALGRDPRLRSVRSPARRSFPGADEHYLLGLALAAQDDPHRAAFHLRRYLAESPVSLWDDRAREHLSAVLEGGLPLALEITGSASSDDAAAQAAFAAARPALEACVADTPDVLYRARLTAFVGGDRRADGAPQPGPRVLVEASFAEAKVRVTEAIACAEGILREVDLPRPQGRAGQYATIEVPLLAP